ncbi:hypothetical protein [Microbacterium sp. NPDC091662]|uniref:hypothetical protein n=1 Tax=Microbacterium sp. NPDC091662 TaxID=3364211 RepID=UPI0038144450
MHAAAAEIYGGLGFGYDPTMEAAEHGIRIDFDPNAADVGEYDPASAVIRVRHCSRTYYRSTATFQLAHAVLERPSIADAVQFAAARLIDRDDLEALASATTDRGVWAKALGIRTWLLHAYLQVRAGLPVTA